MKNLELHLLQKQSDEYILLAGSSYLDETELQNEMNQILQNQELNISPIDSFVLNNGLNVIKMQNNYYFIYQTIEWFTKEGNDFYE